MDIERGKLSCSGTKVLFFSHSLWNESLLVDAIGKLTSKNKLLSLLIILAYYTSNSLYELLKIVRESMTVNHVCDTFGQSPHFRRIILK